MNKALIKRAVSFQQYNSNTFSKLKPDFSETMLFSSNKGEFSKVALFVLGEVKRVGTDFSITVSNLKKTNKQTDPPYITISG